MPGSANLNIMLKTARKAGRLLSKDFRSSLQNLFASSFLLMPQRAVIKIVLKLTPSLLDKGNVSIKGKRNSMQ